VANVKIGIYSFQIVLHDTRALLLKIVRSHVLLFESLIVKSYPQMYSSLIDQLHE
jgi:hypothetical protein